MILGQFQIRRDSSANWALHNPVLLEGEIGLEKDTSQFKIGNGVTPWNSLPYGGIRGPAGTSFVNIQVNATPFVVNSTSDTLKFVQGTGIELFVDEATDTIGIRAKTQGGSF